MNTNTTTTLPPAVQRWLEYFKSEGEDEYVHDYEGFHLVRGYYNDAGRRVDALFVLPPDWTSNPTDNDGRSWHITFPGWSEDKSNPRIPAHVVDYARGIYSLLSP